MRRGSLGVAALVSLVAAASSAPPVIDVEVRSGDKITGTLSPATEVERFRFRCPRGASIGVKAKAAKGGPSLRVIVRSPGAATLNQGEGTKPVVAATTTAETGVFDVLVSSSDGVATGDYALQVVWKSAKSVPVAVTLPAGGDAAAAFAADVGAQFSYSLSVPRGGTAQPAALRIDGPNGYSLPLPGAKAAPIVLPATGDYTLVIHDDGAAGGPVGGAIKLRQPKASKQKIALTSGTIGSGAGDRAFSAVLGPEGGNVAFPQLPDGDPGAALFGSSVSVPVGALTGATAIVISTAPDLPPLSGLEGAGATVNFGPEGLQFRASATVTIPFDLAFTAARDQIQIFTRDARGAITLVPGPYTFDSVAHTVSFAASHFSSFRAAIPPGTKPSEIVSIAQVADLRDVTTAIDTGAAAANRSFYAAEGVGGLVSALVRAGQDLQREVFAGGGASAADGTFRTDFLFLQPAVSVTSGPTGIYVATTNVIYRIDGAGLVTRLSGSGQPIDSPDNTPAAQASYVRIADIIVDGTGALFIADAGAAKIRVIDSVTQRLQTFAGTGVSAVSVDGSPPSQTSLVSVTALEIEPSGALLVADGSRLRRMLAGPGATVATVAGDPAGGAGTSGDDGPPSASLCRSITGISLEDDPANPNLPRVLITDFAAHTLRRIDFTKNTITLIAGDRDKPGYEGDQAALPSSLSGPVSVAAGSGFIVVADATNGRLRLVRAP